jgi:hypothetical protein
MSLAHQLTAGKAGRALAPEGSAGGPPNAHQFFKATRALVFNGDLTSTEKLLIVAIGLYDWGDGRGGHPSNRELVRACGLKADSKDGGQRCIRALLAGLVGRHYLRVQRIASSASNRTGRVLHLLPRAFGVAPDPGSQDPGGPDMEVREPRTSMSSPTPDVQVLQIDPSFSSDPGPDSPPERGPESADENDGERDAEVSPSPYPRLAEKVRPGEPSADVAAEGLTPGQRDFLEGLDADRRARFDQLGPGRRSQLLAGFRFGPDRIAEEEALRSLSRPAPTLPPIPPSSTREMIERLPGGDPALVPSAAEALCRDFGAARDRQLWAALRSLTEQVWRRELSAEDVLDAYRQAMGPRSRVRGAVFTKALRNLGWSP